MTDGGEGKAGWIPSEETKRKIGNANRNPNPTTLKKLSEWKRTPELCRKISEKQKAAAARRTPDGRAILSRLRSKACLSAETIKKMSESGKNKPTITCPHCGKNGRSPGMYRHHFERCRMLEVVNRHK